MLGARLLPMQPTQHSKPPAIRVGEAPTRTSKGPVNNSVDTQGKRSPFLVFVVFHTENIQNTGIYYDLRQPTDHALFTHLHHAMFTQMHKTQNHVLFTHLHQMTDQCTKTGQGLRVALTC